MPAPTSDGGSVFLNKTDDGDGLLDPRSDHRLPRGAAHHAQHDHAVLAAPGGGRRRGARLRLVRAGVAAGGDRDLLRHPRRAASRARPASRRRRARCWTPRSIATARSSSSAGSSTTTGRTIRCCSSCWRRSSASFMVSYATAKAEAMGVAAPRGAMRRGERRRLPDLRRGVHAASSKALFANSASLALHECPIILALTHRRGGLEHLGRAAAGRGDRSAAREGEGAAGRARAGRHATRSAASRTRPAGQV